MISEEDVKNDPALVDAFLSKIYNNVKWVPGEAGLPGYQVLGGEANLFSGWQNGFKAAMEVMNENGSHGLLEYWPYDNIRSANEIIQILEHSDFEEDYVAHRLGEARFLRAYLYFELVKRYGGVPLITYAQSINAPFEELYLQRNSEKEIYDFIKTEMDAVALLLPEEYDASQFGRASKWAALALKSRAMLYAGSIAKYGEVQLDGLLGFSSSDAEDYFTEALNAAKAIIDGGKHPLFREYNNPVENYNKLFLEDGNSEVIFAEVFDIDLLKAHSWNYLCMPDGFKTGWGSNNWLYLESVEKYEYIDGTSGAIERSELDNKTKFDLEELILKRDPRFLANCFYQGIPWDGGNVYSHSTTVGTIPPGSDWPKAAPPRNRAKTGFLIRKRVPEVSFVYGKEGGEDWIVFRTGEMYLNAAEAAFELGQTGIAEGYLNSLRDRAGMPPKKAISIEDIRNERFVELYIEDHRYWDLRRWRIALEELNGKGFHGVQWTYHIEEDKYTLKIKDADFNQKRSFEERNYYMPLGNNRLADNPKLVENPGY
ncbi:RagB/SusD family nutrient uptake outer membrane protein [Draconibacterium orientale]|uniref:RagB/SusD family nutrient uptake outer membrane protein n=1 Tax=Draconibacterium orientale TaxID=1168034 RepID=UPI002ABD76D6|nr:RagB/SusD family nutrient uptake outer membrane protein [Draconibacterium orientale]